MRLLIVLSKEKRFNNNKFYSFRELKKKLIFDYNNKTIEYVMNKYNVNINIAKIYLENLYFLKDLEDNKVKFLNLIVVFKFYGFINNYLKNGFSHTANLHIPHLSTLTFSFTTTQHQQNSAF